MSLSLAILGALLPVLPTTPFVLLAAWAAARGSTRLHARLLAHRTFGPMISQWEASGAVSRRAKRVAIAAMAASGAIVWIVSPRPWVPPLVTAILLAVAAWLWRRPEPPA